MDQNSEILFNRLHKLGLSNEAIINLDISFIGLL